MRFNEIKELNNDIAQIDSPEAIMDSFCLGFITLFEAHIQLAEWNIRHGEYEDAIYELEESIKDDCCVGNLQEFIDRLLIKPACPISFICDLNSRDDILTIVR